jgi:hypothetical protein
MGLDFRTAARNIRRQATESDLSSDDSMDSTMQSADLGHGRTWEPTTVVTDGQDPASPGGPAPYNAAPPEGSPVATDEEYLNPRSPRPQPRQTMPHVQGPDEDISTLHNARRASYETKIGRFR